MVAAGYSSTMPGSNHSTDDAIAKAVSKLRIEAGVPGVRFYDIRHVFRTIADQVGDTEIVRVIMGHSFPGMDRFYLHLKDPIVKRNTLKRIRRVTNHVRKWLALNRGKSA